MGKQQSPQTQQSPVEDISSSSPPIGVQAYGNAAAAEQLPAQSTGAETPLLSQIAGLAPRAASPINLGSVPRWVINGVLAVEQADLSPFEGIEESYKKWREDPTVSLGPAQIQIRRAAELDFPGRDWKATPLTAAEYASYASKLEDPTTNVEYLVREMEDNFAYYGRKPGKSDEDRWRFAIARHKSGHGPIGDAQVACENAGFDPNVWSDVAAFLSSEITSFVERVEAGG